MSSFRQRIAEEKGGESCITIVPSGEVYASEDVLAQQNAMRVALKNSRE